MWYSLSNCLQNLFFPKCCCQCGWLGSYICSACYEKLNFYPFPVHLNIENIYLDQLIAAVEYVSPIKELLHTLKYKNVKDIAQYCAHFLYFTTNFPQTDYITAVPLHSERLKERGYNQSELITQHLSTLLDTPSPTLLQKTKPTLPQAKTASHAQRKTNLQNVFVLANNTANLREKTILLVDDVATTGTTLNECAKVLKEAGAIKVFGLVIAHGT